MVPRFGPDTAPISPLRSPTLRSMVMSSAGVFRMRQVIADLINSVLSGRDSILRFSVRAHVDAFPRFMANNGRFRLPDDRDFYSDVLLAAAMPDDDFPAFTTATSILLIDLLQRGGGSDDLYWNWDSFQRLYRLADPAIRAAIMNGFRFGFELGSINLEMSPSAADCMTLSLEEVTARLTKVRLGELQRFVGSDVSAQRAGALWEEQASSINPSVLIGFRYLYERPKSLTPTQQETAPLIPWS